MSDTTVNSPATPVFGPDAVDNADASKIAKILAKRIAVQVVVAVTVGVVMHAIDTKLKSKND